MVQLFILIIIATLAFTVAYFFFKTIPAKKKMILLAGGVAAAAMGVLLQNVLSLYTALLAIIAVSLIAALIYMKSLEKSELERQRQSEKRRAARQNRLSHTDRISLDKAENGDVPSVVGMTTDKSDRKEF